MAKQFRSPQAAAFIQLGASRDGLDPYLDAAQRRSMVAVLVETPAYLAWRKQLGRRTYTVELPLDHPEDPQAVWARLQEADIQPALVLAGFERYVDSARTLGALCGAAPRHAWMGAVAGVPDKAAQRTALHAHCPEVLQPRWVVIDLHHVQDEAVARVGFPLVLKPSDGGGGLGVYLVRDAAQFQAALSALRGLRNYGGTPFAHIMLEQFVEGTEFSIQGLACNGQAQMLTTCEKIITRESGGNEPDLQSFRESGHIASHGSLASREMRDLAQAALYACGYQQGPFHIDLIANAAGLFFIEMGFRLSGGSLVRLVASATGLDWAELAFQCHMGEPLGSLPAPKPDGLMFVGQVSCTREEELAHGERMLADTWVGEIRRASAPASLHDGAATDPCLRSDILRHTGSLGRILVRASSPEEVRAHLLSCMVTQVD